MNRFKIRVSCPVHDSFRVQQVAGMFDLEVSERARETFCVELPGDRDPWRIGVITGPSGSGKSTVARRTYSRGARAGRGCYVGRGARGWRWSRDRGVIDHFEDLKLGEVLELFVAVGFGSAPAWIKPYHALSTGERFRCDLARALAWGSTGSVRSEDGEARSTQGHDKNADCDAPPHSDGAQPIVVFDEFTSVVDRDVARVCAAAVARGIRSGRIRSRFVAVTCHADVVDWLEPDWVLDMGTGRLARGRLRRRPPIELRVFRCGAAVWDLFKRHHYMNGSLPRHARCYVTMWNEKAVNFCATLPLLGRRGRRRFTRIVTLPDFQGIGIGGRVIDCVARLHRAEGLRISVTSTHPSLLRHCAASSGWELAAIRRRGTRPGGKFAHYPSALPRPTASFEYLGPPSQAPKVATDR